MNRLFHVLPKLSIYLTVFLVPLIWAPWTFESFEFNKQYALFLLVFSGVVAWLTRMVLQDKELRFQRTPLDIPVVAFLLASALSVVFSADRFASLFGYYGRFSDGFIGMVSLVGLYFLIINYIDTKQEVRKLLGIFFASAVIVVLTSYLSLFQIWQRFEFLPSVMKQTSFSLVAGSLEGLSIFLVVVIVFLCAGRLGFKKPEKILHWMVLLGAVALLMFINFTVAWIVLALSLSVLLAINIWQNMQSERATKQALPFVLLLIALVFIFSPFSVREPFEKEEFLDAKTSWSIAWDTVTENAKNILLGSGLGTYGIDFSKHKPEEFNQTSLWQTRFDRSGNHMSEMLATTGFVAFISYGVLIGMFFLITFFIFSVSFAKKNRQAIAVQTSLVLLTLLIAQFFFYQNTALAFLFWFMLALTVVSFSLPRKETRIPLRWFFRTGMITWVVALLFGFVIAGTVFIGASSYMADVEYRTSQTALNPAKKIEAGLKAIQLHPLQAEYRMHLSRLYLERATVEFRKPSAQQDQDLIVADVQKALAYIRGGELQGEVIKGAVEISPNRVAVWETLGVEYRDIQFAEGALDWGVSAFQEALVLEPTNPVLRTELGKLYVAKEEFDKAKEQFNKATVLKPDYIPARLQIALLNERKGEVASAISTIEGLAREGFSAEVLFQLGRLYYNEGRISQAILQFQKIIQLVPNHSNAHFSLGVAYEKQGKNIEAQREFERVLELNPGNAAIQAKLDRL